MNIRKLFCCFSFVFLFIILLLNFNYNYFNEFVLNTTFSDKTYYDFFSSKIDIFYNNKINFLNKNLRIMYDDSILVKPTIKHEITEPTIYLYNSHQTEEYCNSSVEYTVKPTVMVVDYILEELFLKSGYKSIIEEDSIKNILNSNRWNYAYSYRASRILMEKSKNEHPSLKYFIDIHRDSLRKDRTTVDINGKKYAKILFILGLENKNFSKNEVLISRINSIINTKYPRLSKGIYKKQGPGVNGVYNQDFSENTFLIEVGGVDNTPMEILNTSIAFAECFLEAIK